MKKTFKFKLYCSKRNKYLHNQIDIAAEIYNHCIALHKRYYRLSGKSLNVYQLQKHITKLKRLDRYIHWNGLGSQAIQDIAERIQRGYRLFFNSLKTERKVAPPTFKKRIKYKSFTLKQAGYKLLDDNKIRIGNHIFKFHKSREIEGKVKTLTVKRDSLGDIYLYFCCEVEDVVVPRLMTGKSAGFDFGLKTFLQPSDGSEPIESPLFFKQGIKTVKRANQSVSKKRKGSNHRKEAKLHLARVHKRIANQRRDFHFQLATRLARTYDHIFFETLNIKGMQRMWGRKVSDLGFSDFVHIQKYVCQKCGSVIGFIDRFFPSSRLCYICGCINTELELKDREWICSGCQTKHNRDENAAINILREGASSLGLEGVRPAYAGGPCLTPESHVL